MGEFPPSPELAKGFLARYANYNTHTLYRYTHMVKSFMQWYGDPLTDVHIKIPKSLPSYTEDVDIEKLLDAIGDKGALCVKSQAYSTHLLLRDSIPISRQVHPLGAFLPFVAGRTTLVSCIPFGPSPDWSGYWPSASGRKLGAKMEFSVLSYR